MRGRGDAAVADRERAARRHEVALLHALLRMPSPGRLASAEAAASSQRIWTSPCKRSAEAGQAGLIGPSIAAAIAAAFSRPVAIRRMLSASRIFSVPLANSTLGVH